VKSFWSAFCFVGITQRPRSELKNTRFSVSFSQRSIQNRVSLMRFSTVRISLRLVSFTCTLRVVNASFDNANNARVASFSIDIYAHVCLSHNAIKRSQIKWFNDPYVIIIIKYTLSLCRISTSTAPSNDFSFFKKVNDTELHKKIK
jgi:hypothetical protein